MFSRDVVFVEWVNIKHPEKLRIPSLLETNSPILLNDELHFQESITPAHPNCLNDVPVVPRTRLSGLSSGLNPTRTHKPTGELGASCRSSIWGDLGLRVKRSGLMFGYTLDCAWSALPLAHRRDQTTVFQRNCEAIGSK